MRSAPVASRHVIGARSPSQFPRASQRGTIRSASEIDTIVDDALFQTFDHLPRQKRRDADIVSTAIEKAVRNAIAGAWGKRPAVHVLVVEV